MRVNGRVPPPEGLAPGKFPRTRERAAFESGRRVGSRTDERPPRRRIAGRARGLQALPDRRHGRRHDAAGQAALEARSRRDRRARGTVAGRRSHRLGDERQDDDDRDGGRDPRAGPQARLEPLRREPRLRGRLHPPRRARRRSGPARGRRGRTAGGRSPDQAPRGAARQPLPRPARPLRRARAHRRALARATAALPRGDRARRQRRRPPGRRPGARPLRTRSPMGSTIPAMPAPRSSTRPIRATASAAGSRTSSPPPTWAISATTAALPAVTPGPRCRYARREIELDGLHAASFTLDTPAGSTRLRLPLPGLYNVYNALGAAALAQSLGASLEEIRAGLERFGAAFGRFERIPAGDKTLLVLLIKNPAGRERGRAHAARGRSTLAPARGAERRDRRREGRLVDLGRRLRAAARPSERLIASGDRAAELGLRCVYGGLPKPRSTWSRRSAARSTEGST